MGLSRQQHHVGNHFYATPPPPPPLPCVTISHISGGERLPDFMVWQTGGNPCQRWQGSGHHRGRMLQGDGHPSFGTDRRQWHISVNNTHTHTQIVEEKPSHPCPTKEEMDFPLCHYVRRSLSAS